MQLALSQKIGGRLKTSIAPSTPKALQTIEIFFEILMVWFQNLPSLPKYQSDTVYSLLQDCTDRASRDSQGF